MQISFNTGVRMNIYFLFLGVCFQNVLLNYFSRYLSQGVSRNFLAWSFRMGASTVREIIIEVCDVLWKVLSPTYMTQLNTVDWKMVADEFHSKWQMPNCLGSIDGKHVQIKCPPKSGSKYYNYKGHFSIVLLGVCDANYVFTAVDVGAYGSQSDGGIFRNAEFGKKVLHNLLNVPGPTKLPNSNKITPLFFVGDNAFPLRTNLMRPYPGLLLETKKDAFNYRLSRARRVIENAFGILSTRWRILLSCIEFYPSNADKVIVACTILHNFLKITESLYNNRSYCPANYVDSYDDENNVVPGLWRQEHEDLTSIRRFGSHNSSRDAFAIRETLAEYFMNEGKINSTQQ